MPRLVLCSESWRQQWKQLRLRKRWPSTWGGGLLKKTLRWVRLVGLLYHKPLRLTLHIDAQSMKEEQDRAHVSATNEVARLRLEITTRDATVHKLTTERGTSLTLAMHPRHAALRR